MKLTLDKNSLDQTVPQILRGLGYGFIIDKKSGQESYVRSLGRNFYPRFHLYLEEASNKIIFNLHLDQKRPSYSGSNAHNAEYEGEVVENEMQRIEKIITYNL